MHQTSSRPPKTLGGIPWLGIGFVQGHLYMLLWSNQLYIGHQHIRIGRQKARPYIWRSPAYAKAHAVTQTGRYFFADDARVRPPSLSVASKFSTEPHTHSQLASEKLPPMTPPEPERDPDDTIHRLLRNPTLYDPIRTPRFPIVLCHG